MSRPTTSLSPVTAAVILAALFGLLLVLVVAPTSNDLRAVWMAGRFFETGPVYAGSEGLFTMMPPPVWVDTLRSEGAEGPVFPFIYPPLWAWVAAQVASVIEFSSFARIASLVNTALVVTSLWLACRIVRPAVPRDFLLIGAVLCVAILSITLALEENQPQILVSFLILLGIERARAGSPIVAGMAMALAASLKLYPVIFALLWWVSGDRRATLMFVITGLILGLLSIAVAGWEMHAAFLGEIAAISNTIFLSLANFSLDQLMGELVRGPEALMRLEATTTGEAAAWLIGEKSATWRLWGGGVQLLALGGLIWIAKTRRMRDALLWPAAIFVVAWLSPLSWIYHYMTMFFFLPALVDRLGPRIGLPLIVVIIFPSSYLVLLTGVRAMMDPTAVVLLTNATLVLAGGLFLWLGMREKPVS